MALLRSIVTIASFTLISRVFGFARDILIAAILGAGPVADAFFVAFKFPNLFRRLFAEGAFNAAFVPIFTGILERDGQAAARRFAEHAFAVLAWVLVVFVVIIEIAMPAVMYGFAPGFADDPRQFDLAVTLTRITFPYLLFISLVAMMAGILNSLGRFAAAAATPILLNLCLIGAVLLAARFIPGPGHALAWGVAAAGVIQFAWLAYHVARAGMALRPVWPRLTPAVRRLGRRILPGAVGAGVYQVNLLIDTIIASFLPAGSISYLFFADRVNQLPLGLVGVAVGTALLPVMSRQLSAGDAAGAGRGQNRALEFSLLLGLPAAVALGVIAGPLISVLFERGAFGADQVVATAAALAVYAIGLPAYVLAKALTPGFFARQDTATPVKAAAAAMAVNLGLNLALMGPLLHVGIALATAVSAWLNVAILFVILRRRGHLEIDARLRRRLPRMAAASVLMGAVLFAARSQLAAPLAGAAMDRVWALAALIIAGLAAFSIAAVLLRAASIGDVRGLFGRRGG